MRFKIYLTHRGGCVSIPPQIKRERKGNADMAVKKTGLPKGITWREDRHSYLGRVTFQGQAYVLYDKNWKRLDLKLQELRVELRKGTYVKETSLTLNQWFDQWMELYKNKKLKYGSIRSYNNHFNYYIRKGIGKKKLKDIKADDIQKLYNNLCDNGYSTGSIKIVATILSGCYKKAFNNRMIAFNPVPMAEIPNGKEKEEKYVFTKEQQDIFRKYIKESYLCNFFEIMLMSSMRIGEARALRWMDIDFEKKLISVNHTLVETTGGGYMLDTPKTKKSKRKIPMLETAYEILKGMKENAENMNIGGEENYVFCLPDGSEISRFRVEYQLKKIEERMVNEDATVGHISSHTLRHSFATRAIESGMKPQTLKVIMGHSSLSMTMDLYAHVLGEEKVQEMILLENLF